MYDIIEEEYQKNIHETTDTLLLGDIIKLKYNEGEGEKEKEKEKTNVYTIVYIDKRWLETEEETFEIRDGEFWRDKKKKRETHFASFSKSIAWIYKTKRFSRRVENRIDFRMFENSSPH